jgi:4-carboxymuconolactone decarboxylase
MSSDQSELNQKWSNMSKARIPLPTPEEMTAEQRSVYNSVVNGRRGQMIGPLRAAIYNPQLAGRWSEFGEQLRYGTSLSQRHSELAILVTARHWTSQLEWWVHSLAAAGAMLPEEIINAIRLAQTPPFADRADTLIYEFARQLLRTGTTELSTYQAVEDRWGAVGVVELAALIGYYTMVAMTLKVHDIPLPEGAVSLLPLSTTGSTTELPPAHDLAVPSK